MWFKILAVTIVLLVFGIPALLYATPTMYLWIPIAAIVLIPTVGLPAIEYLIKNASKR